MCREKEGPGWENIMEWNIWSRKQQFWEVISADRRNMDKEPMWNIGNELRALQKRWTGQVTAFRNLCRGSKKKLVMIESIDKSNQRKLMDLRNLLERLVKKMAWKHQDQPCGDLLKVVDARSGKAMLTLLKVMLCGRLANGYWKWIMVLKNGRVWVNSVPAESSHLST